jgi:hypothetical protein
LIKTSLLSRSFDIGYFVKNVLNQPNIEELSNSKYNALALKELRAKLIIELTNKNSTEENRRIGSHNIEIITGLLNVKLILDYPIHLRLLITEKIDPILVAQLSEKERINPGNDLRKLVEQAKQIEKLLKNNDIANIHTKTAKNNIVMIYLSNSQYRGAKIDPFLIKFFLEEISENLDLDMYDASKLQYFSKCMVDNKEKILKANNGNEEQNEEQLKKNDTLIQQEIDGKLRNEYSIYSGIIPLDFFTEISADRIIFSTELNLINIRNKLYELWTGHKIASLDINIVRINIWFIDLKSRYPESFFVSIKRKI